MATNSARRRIPKNVVCGLLANRPLITANGVIAGDEFYCRDTGQVFLARYLPGGILTWTEIALPPVPPLIEAENYPADPSVQVRDAVYLGADGIVRPALATGAATMPCIGIVIDIPLPGIARVQRDGPIYGLFLGLTVAATYYVSPVTAGGITASAPLAVGQYVHRLGFAADGMTLTLQLDRDYQIL